MSLLPLLFIAHLAGDFLLQNHWMQRKSASSFVCTVHVLAYSLPFIALISLGLSAWVLGLILCEHWLQDRFALHVKWMGLYRQTTPDKWPVGPLCVDQAWHLVSIATFVLMFNHP